MFSDIVTTIGNELDLNMSDTKTVTKVYYWCNAIYRNVVHSDQFPWRMRNIPIITKAIGEGTSVSLVYGNTAVSAIDQDGTINADSAYNFMLVDGYDVPLEIETSIAYGGPDYTLLITLHEPCPLASGSYDITVPHCRYSLDNMREDWIIGVYNHTLDKELRRIYPNDHLGYLQRGMKQPAVPEYYYLESGDDDKSSLLCLSPSPDDAYELTVRAMLGTTIITADTSNTIIPTEFEEDLFVSGVAFLYSMAHKDDAGKTNYGGLYNAVLGRLNSSAKKQPGRKKVMLGYLAKDAGVVDRDVPDDWTY